MNKSTILFLLSIAINTQQEESKRLLERYPDRIPVICKKLDGQQVKYLTPQDFTVGQFIYASRKGLKIPPEVAVFLLARNNTLPPTSSLMSKVYDNHKDSDGFLYLTLTEENVFG